MNSSVLIFPLLGKFKQMTQKSHRLYKQSLLWVTRTN